MSAAAKFIDQLQASRPDLAEPLGELLALYNKKLYHELTLKLEELIASPAFQQGDVLVHIYHNFVEDVEQKLNKLKLAHIAVAASSRYEEKASAIAFLGQVATKLGSDGSPGSALPALYVRMHVALLHLQRGEQGAAKALVDAAQEQLDAATVDVDASVRAAFHFAAAQLAKAKRDYADFYRMGMLYLAHISVASLPEGVRQALAVDLALAALLGDTVYNFGELLAHPVLASLAGTPAGWLPELLAAANAGDLAAYGALCARHAAALNAQPDLVARERQLREKVTVLALLEMVSKLPPAERTLPLARVAERTQLSVDGVEMLLMRALSQHLIEGSIDQVDGVVSVTWVQPRVLLLPQVAQLRDKVAAWAAKVHDTRLALEAEAPELAVGAA